MGIWGESLSAMTWIEAVTLEKICYKKELGKYRVKRKCRDIFCPPFLPCLHTPQLLTFGRLQNTDFCSWGSRVKIRQYSNLEHDTFVSCLIIGHIWVFFFFEFSRIFCPPKFKSYNNSLLVLKFFKISSHTFVK